jgi:hypothetical protein
MIEAFAGDGQRSAFKEVHCPTAPLPLKRHGELTFGRQSLCAASELLAPGCASVEVAGGPDREVLTFRVGEVDREGHLAT